MYEKLRLLTSDKFILDSFDHDAKLGFKKNLTNNYFCCFPTTSIEQTVVSRIKYKKQVIVPATKNDKDSLSGVLTRCKKSGSHRMILKLKMLKKHI